MGSLWLIWCALVLSLSAQDYPLKKGKPTHRGIVMYVEQEAPKVLREFQEFTGDSIYEVEILPADRDDHWEGKELELGHFFPNEIYVSTAEAYEAYELADLKAWRRKNLRESNLFVKAVMLHELTHAYIYQTGQVMMDVDQIWVHPAYRPGIWMAHPGETFGSVFIGEGICEYVCGEMGEILLPEHPRVPQSREDLLKEENRYWVQYIYAAAFLDTFLDTTGLKEGIRILFHNPPPTEEEILEPELYFGRLHPPKVQQPPGSGLNP
jgi:hypothetical protein